MDVRACMCVCLRKAGGVEFKVEDFNVFKNLYFNMIEKLLYKEVDVK